MASLADRDYWDDRYTLDAEPFDWYLCYSTCQPYRELLSVSLRTTDETLIVGAGSSRLAEELFAASHRSVYNVDFSPVCIRGLVQRYDRMGIGPITSSVQDVCSLDFDDESFDAVIDKATVDSLLCEEGAVERALKEISRVLRSGGVFLLLSILAPSPSEGMGMMPMLQQPEYGWECEHHKVPKPEVSGANYYLYVLKRGERERTETPEPVEKEKEKKKFLDVGSDRQKGKGSPS